MRAAPPMTWASPMTPALLPAQGRQRDGPGQSNPPAPRPHGHPSSGAAHRPPPPPRQAGPLAAGRTWRPGLPHDPDPTRTPGGDVPAMKWKRGRGPQAAPPKRGEAGSYGAPPPPCPPIPPGGPRAAGAPAPHPPPEAEGTVPPPHSRGAAPGREAGAGPASTPQPPAPAGTAMDRRTRANTQGRHTDRARGQQASTNRSGMGATPPMARATPSTPALLPA